MTLIEITTSGGGFGGIPLEATKTVTLSDLPQEQATLLCDAFAPKVLEALAGTEDAPGKADTMTYSIKITDQDGLQSYTLDETQLPPELLDLIDDLMAGAE